MSRADEIFVANMKDIMENGFSDENLQVRPHWEDGTPAHTIKKFCIVNRYNLQEELPILTIRRTAFKSCLDELLWIWQKKSNNIHDLKSHIWDSWADDIKAVGIRADEHRQHIGPSAGSEEDGRQEKKSPPLRSE